MGSQRQIIFRIGAAVSIGLLSTMLVISVFASLASSLEQEPNDSTGTANSLNVEKPIEGAIDPIGDVDYFTDNGINDLWGYVALLDTSASETSKDSTLTAYAADGLSMLQQDSGSWLQGSVLAWQRFVDGNSPFYVKISESGDDSTITTYSLRFYEVALSEQDEVEPNDLPDTGTISAKSMLGMLSDSMDVDCFRFSGLVNEDFIFALNADPDNNGSTTDFGISIYDPSGLLLVSADVGGLGSNEVIDNLTLTQDGVYAYCVDSPSGVVGQNDEYIVGPIRNERNYLPTYQVAPVWLDPGPDGVAILGDTLSFQLNFTNTSLITIPGRINLFGRFDDACLELVSAPGAVYTYSDQVKWEKYDLSPGQNFSTFFETRAIAGCTDNVHESVSMDYFSLGVGGDADYQIQPGIYLPLLINK